jgi:hypothetical protein
MALAACPVALFIGDTETAERSVAMLLDHSAKLALGAWNAWGRCYKGALLIKRGDFVTGLRLLRTALDELRGTSFVLRYTEFLGALAEGLAGTG